MKRYLPAILALCHFSIGFGQTDPNAVVLTVNGDTIKASEYYRRMEFLPGTSRRIGSTALVYPPGFLTLEAMITERLVFQLAKQKGAMPSDAEITSELNAALQENPKLLIEAEIAGQTRDDVIRQLRYQLAQFKLTTFGITVTDTEVDKFYRDNPGAFIVPKRAKLRWIIVSDEATKGKIDSELSAGKAFADVAKIYSEDPTSKDAGGDFGTVPIDALPEAARNAVNATKIKASSLWIIMPGTTRHAKFYLEDVLPESKINLDAKLRDQIRRQLMVQRGQARNDVGKELNELRAKSKIDIANKTFAELYKKYLEEIAKENRGGS